MSKQKDSDDLVRVGPGTVMGGLMRQYWIPAAMSSELERDGAPMRLMLLGERLIAFRDSSGRVGVMDHRCPHRCASLFLGRNEEDGIRCVYHGWKFDTAGNCVDMPNAPPHQDYKDKVRAKAYKVAERNGLVWVYMGERAEAPPLPGIEASLLPESELQITFAQRECNWLQALEGDIDTSHFGFLHAGSVDRGRSAGRQSDPLDGRQPRARIPRRPTPIGARCTPPIARPRRARPIGASPISCFRSGRRRRRAPSTGSTAAAGSRWTTPTRCSSACRGKACRRTARRSATAGCSPAPS